MKRLGAILTELDAVADSVQEADPRIALAIDSVSDGLEMLAAVPVAPPTIQGPAAKSPAKAAPAPQEAAKILLKFQKRFNEVRSPKINRLIKNLQTAVSAVPEPEKLQWMDPAEARPYAVIFKKLKDDLTGQLNALDGMWGKEQNSYHKWIENYSKILVDHFKEQKKKPGKGPVAPAISEKPAAPGAPEKPAAPGAPEKPAAPGAPEKPAAPGAEKSEYGEKLKYYPPITLKKMAGTVQRAYRAYLLQSTPSTPLRAEDDPQ